jgi:hypothetical protein
MEPSTRTKQLDSLERWAGGFWRPPAWVWVFRLYLEKFHRYKAISEDSRERGSKRPEKVETKEKTRPGQGSRTEASLGIRVASSTVALRQPLSEK